MNENEETLLQQTFHARFWGALSSPALGERSNVAARNDA